MRIETFLGQVLRRGLAELLRSWLRGLAAVSSEPNSAEAYVRRGAARVGEGDDDGAIADCTKSIRMNPSYLAYCTRGAAYIGKEKYKEAISDLTVAIQLNPTNGSAYYLRSKAYAGRDAPDAIDGSRANAIIADAIAADRLGLHEIEWRETTKRALDFFVTAWAAGQCPPGLSEEVKAYLDAAARERQRRG